MRNSRQHGPRSDFRGARRERPGQGGGHGGGRKRNRRRSEHSEEDRQGPPQTRGARRERPRQAYGKSEHRPPQNRRDRRRSEYPEGDGHGPPRVRGPRRERPRQAYGKSEHRPPQDRRDRRRERPRQAHGKSEHRPPQDRRDRRRSPQVNFTQDHPMKDLYTLHDSMGHVLGRMAAFREEKSQKGKSDWNPSLDFFETEDRFEVLVELPGVSQDDVNVSIAENQLVIKGKKQKEQTDETQNLHHSERRYGKFHRVFPLPPNAVAADDIKAEFKDGVLKLVIPKTEAAKPTDIPISGDA